MESDDEEDGEGFPVEIDKQVQYSRILHWIWKFCDKGK